MWHSNRSVAENVKQIKKTKKTGEEGRDEEARRRRKHQEGEEIPRRTRDRRSAAREAGARTAGALPDFVPPQLATLQRHARRTAPDWVHEVKFDGYRMQARLEDGKVRLLTRKALDWTAQIPARRRCGRRARRRHAR